MVLERLQKSCHILLFTSPWAFSHQQAQHSCFLQPFLLRFDLKDSQPLRHCLTEHNQFPAFLLCLERHGILYQSEKWHLSSMTYRDQGTRNSSLTSETYYQKTNSTSVVRNHRCPSASVRETRGRGGDCGDLGAGADTQGWPLDTFRSRVTGSSVGPGLPGLVSFIRSWKSRCLCDLEKEMATHSSILAWRIPWTEEPGGLQSLQGLAKSQTRLMWLSIHACNLKFEGWNCSFFLSRIIGVFCLPELSSATFPESVYLLSFILGECKHLRFSVQTFFESMV